MSLAEEVTSLLPQGLVSGYVGVVKSISSSGVATVDVRGALLECPRSNGYVPVVGDNVMLMRVDSSNSWTIAFKIAATGVEPWKPVPLAPGVTQQAAGYQPLMYKMHPTIPSTLWVVGRVGSTTVMGNGFVVGTLPVGYRPKSTINGSIYASGLGPQGNNSPVYEVQTNGNIAIWGSAGTVMAMNDFIPLDL